MGMSGSLLLLLRLAVSLLCAVINGIDLSFNVYAVSLKETFNFTQTQVEIAASMGCIGFGLTFLETLTTAAFGYTVTFALTLIVLPLSGGMFSLAAVHKHFFHSWPTLLYLIQLFLSTSNGIALMSVTRVCLEIVPEEHTATFIGLFGSAICFGKIFFAGLYDIFFLQDLAGFFFCLAVLSFIFLALCYVLLYPVAMDIEERARQGMERVNSIDYEPVEQNSLTGILRSPFFHVTFWTATVFSSVGYAILNNITSVTDSIGMSNAFTIVTTMSLCIMSTRLLYGILYDKVSSPYAGLLLLFSTYLSLGTGVVIGMYFLNSTTVFILTVLSGIGIGPAFTLPVAILVDHFGRSTYSMVSALLFAAVALGEFLLQLVVGLLYDAQSADLGRTDSFCYGTQCFFRAFQVLLALTLSVLVVQAVNFAIMVYNSAKT